MSPPAWEGVAAATWLGRAGIQLRPEEAVLFLEAARVLLPAGLDLQGAVRAGTEPSEPQRDALRGLWLRTGAPPRAPAPMPLQPLDAGVLSSLWRRVRESLARAPGPEVE